MLYNPKYTLTQTGKGVKILRTAGRYTVSVATVNDPPLAERLCDKLNELGLVMGTVLWVAAQRADHQPSTIRRTSLSAFDSALDGGSGRPDKGAERFAHELAELSRQLPAAVRAAVRDELAAVFEDSEDVLVPIVLSSGEWSESVVLNPFLDNADDDTVYVLLHEDPQMELENEAVPALADLFDGIDRVMADAYSDTDQGGYVECELDRAALAAWVARHRPHLSQPDS